MKFLHCVIALYIVLLANKGTIQVAPKTGKLCLGNKRSSPFPQANCKKSIMNGYKQSR